MACPLLLDTACLEAVVRCCPNLSELHAACAEGVELDTLLSLTSLTSLTVDAVQDSAATTVLGLLTSLRRLAIFESSPITPTGLQGLVQLQQLTYLRFPARPIASQRSKSYEVTVTLAPTPCWQR